MMLYLVGLAALLLLPSRIYALNFGDTCDSRLKYSKSGAFEDDCDDVYLYCNSTLLTCQYKGCSNTDYINGWDTSIREIPERCASGYFCPDNGSRCMPTVPIGSPCELLRDDECQGSTSICLNSTCFVKAAPLGGNCGSESTTFTSYLAGGEEFLQTTIRDNCTMGTYCSLNALCISSKTLGSSCAQDRECISESCSNEDRCVEGPDVFHKIQPWTWGVIAAAIVIFIALVMLSLWFLHRFQSKKEHAKIVKFFGDNEEFSKYAMLHDDDDDSMYLDKNDSRGRIYLTTPDYLVSQSLTLKNRSSSSLISNPFNKNPSTTSFNSQ